MSNWINKWLIPVRVSTDCRAVFTMAMDDMFSAASSLRPMAELEFYNCTLGIYNKIFDAFCNATIIFDLNVQY